MSWPASTMMQNYLDQPGRIAFPGPANDNIRSPRTNVPYRGPSPANDNVPRKAKGLKLPGVRRLLPVAMLGFGLAERLYRETSAGDWEFVPNGPGIIIERIGTDCGPGIPTHRFPYGSLCSVPWPNVPQETPPNMDQIVVPTWPSVVQWQMNEYAGEHSLPNYYVWDRVGRGYQARRQNATTTANRINVQREIVKKTKTLPNPITWTPTPLRPGRYIAPKQVMPEWPDSGYGAVRPRLQPRWLRSSRPGRFVRERKVTLRNFALGRFANKMVGSATEALDFQKALFESLPFWRIMALYNKARRLELQYSNGRVVAGRLHYVDLTPDQKAKAIYDYIDEIDQAKAVATYLKMQFTDMLWANIGQGMGRYQVGPWDGEKPTRKTDPEWEWYVPDVDPATEHAHWTYETLVNKRLTRKEAERIHKRFDAYRDQPYSERKYK